MTWTHFEIAPGTPFFHGTIHAGRVIRGGVASSNATPGGRQITGFAWFFASHSPAASYCVCDMERHTPAVIEFRTNKALIFADLRDTDVLPKRDPRENMMQAICKLSLSGVVIRNTTSTHDFEYGFVSMQDLDYVGYEIPHDSWRISQEKGFEPYCAMSDEETATYQQNLETSNALLRNRIEQELRASG